MISCLVVYLNANDAGTGFYNLAHSKHLLPRGADRTEFWVRQAKSVHDYFARR